MAGKTTAENYEQPLMDPNPEKTVRNDMWVQQKPPYRRLSICLLAVLGSQDIVIKCTTTTGVPKSGFEDLKG